jgi:hypothetical protein
MITKEKIMKLIEQYLRAISYNLPLSKRKDVVEELRSLMMDEIEQRFGAEPGENDLRDYINEFGAPNQVAARYRSGRGVIAEGFRDIYFMIIKIVFAAMLVAFTTVFFVELATGPVPDRGIIVDILMIPLRALQGGISATGLITLVFILLTRFASEKLELAGFEGSDWSVEELKHISLEEEAGNLAAAIAGLIFGGIAIMVLLLFPQVFSFLEQLFERSGIVLGHYINTEAFRPFTYALTALWLAEMAVQVMIIRMGRRTQRLIDASAAVTLAEVLLFALLAFLPGLYSQSPEWISSTAPILTGPWWLGTRMIFFIGFLATAAETVAWIVKKGSNIYLKSGKKS